MKLNKEVFIPIKADLERVPPTVTTALFLRDIGYDIHILCISCNEELEEDLKNTGIMITKMGSKKISNKFAEKVFIWRTFKSMFWNCYKMYKNIPVLWIGSADTALAIGPRVLKVEYVIQVLELYDKKCWYRILLKKYCRKAADIVVPDECRAAILRVWYKLSSTPHVIPNKPYLMSIKTNESNIPEYSRVVAGRKLVLYQAQNLRIDIMDVIKAVKSLGSEYAMGILGRIWNKKIYDNIKREYPNIIEFGYIPAPKHLEVTKHAYIGLLYYDYSSLNNVFCAPNKVWEYSSLGLPMICNELPMLSERLERYKAGVTFKTGDVESVMRAINEIDSNYTDYRMGAFKYFESIDMRERYRQLIEDK